MAAQLEYIFYTYEEFAIVISIIVNIVMSMIGFVPSVFLTVLNIKFFGLETGTMISFVGEVLGVIMAFWLYRRGFQRFAEKRAATHPRVQRLLHIEGRDAFFLLLTLRLLPFVPSGAVTLFAALGKVSLRTFALASAIGKIPALLIEAYSVHAVLTVSWTGKLIIGAILLACLCIWYWKKAK